MNPKNDPVILVLGVGGNVSQSILKAVSISKLRCRVIGACISPEAMGLYTVDKAYISPRADEPSFLPWLLDVCRRDGVRGILSGVEPVLSELSRCADVIRRETGAIPIVSRPEQLSICNDKIETSNWLRDQGMNYPMSADASDPAAVRRLVDAFGFPLFVKPRAGKGSAGAMTVRNETELSLVCKRPGYVCQRHLADSENEFTAGTFTDKDGKLRGVIVMRRNILSGTTAYAEAGAFPEVTKQVRRIAEQMKPLGPCNMQLRLVDGKPVCFEINLRFSGTTCVRARLGFNDVEAAIRHFVLGEPAADLPVVTEGIVLRYWNEIYVNPRACAALRESGHLDAPQHFNLSVEDYGMRP